MAAATATIFGTDSVTAAPKFFIGKNPSYNPQHNHPQQVLGGGGNGGTDPTTRWCALSTGSSASTGTSLSSTTAGLNPTAFWWNNPQHPSSALGVGNITATTTTSGFSSGAGEISVAGSLSPSPPVKPKRYYLPLSLSESNLALRLQRAEKYAAAADTISLRSQQQVPAKRESALLSHSDRRRNQRLRAFSDTSRDDGMELLQQLFLLHHQNRMVQQQDFQRSTTASAHDTGNGLLLISDKRNTQFPQSMSAQNTIHRASRNQMMARNDGQNDVLAVENYEQHLDRLWNTPPHSPTRKELQQNPNEKHHHQKHWIPKNIRRLFSSNILTSARSSAAGPPFGDDVDDPFPHHNQQQHKLWNKGKDKKQRSCTTARHWSGERRTSGALNHLVTKQLETTKHQKDSANLHEKVERTGGLNKRLYKQTSRSAINLNQHQVFAPTSAAFGDDRRGGAFFSPPPPPVSSPMENGRLIPDSTVVAYDRYFVSMSPLGDYEEGNNPVGGGGAATVANSSPAKKSSVVRARSGTSPAARLFNAVVGRSTKRWYNKGAEGVDGIDSSANSTQSNSRNSLATGTNPDTGPSSPVIMVAVDSDGAQNSSPSSGKGKKHRNCSKNASKKSQQQTSNSSSSGIIHNGEGKQQLYHSNQHKHHKHEGGGGGGVISLANRLLDRKIGGWRRARRSFSSPNPEAAQKVQLRQIVLKRSTNNKIENYNCCAQHQRHSGLGVGESGENCHCSTDYDSDGRASSALSSQNGDSGLLLQQQQLRVSSASQSTAELLDSTSTPSTTNRSSFASCYSCNCSGPSSMMCSVQNQNSIHRGCTLGLGDDKGSLCSSKSSVASSTHYFLMLEGGEGGSGEQLNQLQSADEEDVGGESEEVDSPSLLDKTWTAGTSYSEQVDGDTTLTGETIIGNNCIDDSDQNQCLSINADTTNGIQKQSPDCVVSSVNTKVCKESAAQQLADLLRNSADNYSVL